MTHDVRDEPTATNLPEKAAGLERQAETAVLGDAIAELAARIQAATYELLVMVREFDDREGWGGGFTSCAHWLNWRTGLAMGAAREKVRVARALAELPRLSAAMRRGALSYSKVRALTRVATPETEERLLDFARCATAAHVERLVRAWRRVERIAAAEDDRRRHDSRHLEVWVDDDGMLVVRGRLSPEVGAVVQRALEAASDRLYHDAEDKAEVSVGQRRADALGLLAESALSADLDRGTAGDRYQVVVHVEADGLGADVEAGQSALEDGIGVSAETSRRLACDASTVVMTHARDGQVLAARGGSPAAFDRRCIPAGGVAPRSNTAGIFPRPALRRTDAASITTGLGATLDFHHGLLDVGRKTRTIPPAIRRALTARDRRCRFPGCDAYHCDAHHVRHWADGGTTRLDNLLLVCRRHHRAVHEEGFRVELRDDGEACFFWPDGRPLPDVPPAPTWTGTALASTDAHLETAGLTIDPHTATPDWLGERLDLDWAITVLHPATADPPRRDLSAGTSSTADGIGLGDVPDASVPPDRTLTTASV